MVPCSGRLGLLLLLVPGCFVSASSWEGRDRRDAADGGGWAASPAPPFEERAAKLVAAMSLVEKVSQLDTDSPAIPRLNITAWNWWQECLHGAVDWRTPGRGGTIFPQPLGLAATFDPSLLHRIATAISDELRAKDNEQFAASGRHMMTSCFGPNINIFRDPRWGRGSETYGEDPALTALMAEAFVTGMQGNHSHYVKVGATCKHFAAYSLEEWEGISRFAFDAKLDPRDIEDTYLPAFRACVAGAGAFSVMCSYNSLGGTPACANPWLLGEELRGRMGFGGFVVSDCGAIDSIHAHHGFTNTSAQAAAAALKAGTDLACLDYSALLQAVADGLVSEAEVGQAVERVLLARFRLGHFDPPEANPYSRIPPSVIGHRSHLALAREAAAKGIVLLKNEEPQECRGGGGGKGRGKEEGGTKKTLPLDLARLGRITVVGPLANCSEYLLGNYYGHPWGEITTPLQAIQEYVSVHSQGGSRGEDAPPQVDYVLGSEVMGTSADVEAVVSACRGCDACIFFVGTTMLEGDYQERERAGTYPVLATTVENEGHDRRSLLLPGGQLDLIQAATKRTSTPLVVVLLHGGPLDVEWLQNSPRVGAILTAWFPGQGAAALADILFGEVSPSGRLPVTFYFENYTRQIDMAEMRMRPWPGRTHRFLHVPALYPFGWGLSYTSFEYSELSVAQQAQQVQQAQQAQHRGSATGQAGALSMSELAVEVEVRNTGGMVGEEVVLVFLSFTAEAGIQRAQQGRTLAQHAERGQQGGARGWATMRMACAEPVVGGEPQLAAAAPRQTLAAFTRVSLAPGEVARVVLRVSPAQLAAAASGALEQGPSSGRAAAGVACGVYEVRVGPLAQKLVLVGEPGRA